MVYQCISATVYQLWYTKFSMNMVKWSEIFIDILRCNMSLLYVPATILLIRTGRYNANMVWHRFHHLWLWAIGEASSFLMHKCSMHADFIWLLFLCIDIHTHARQILQSLTMLDTIRCRYTHIQLEKSCLYAAYRKMTNEVMLPIVCCLPLSAGK